MILHLFIYKSLHDNLNFHDSKRENIMIIIM